MATYRNKVVLLVHHVFTRFCLAAKVWEPWDWETENREREGDLVGQYLNQVKKAQQAAAGALQGRDPDFEKAYPALWEFVSVTKHADGTRREVATLLAFQESGMWKVCLGDRDSGLSLWAAAETYQEALEALEACLQSPNPQWRQGAKRTPRRP